MPIYRTPLRDMNFVLKEMISLKNIQKMPYYQDLSEDVTDAVLHEAAKFSENVIFPLNMSGDTEGCHWQDQKVTTPKGFKEAYQAFIEGGWPSLSGDPAEGGQKIPEVVGLLVEEIICASNLSFSLYPGLTRGAALLLKNHGTEDLKKKYFTQLCQGIWTGTMCLTESHCGTDLGLLKTMAVPQADGSYKLTGTKIFISAGDHDLTDNIIHFVLARTPNAPAGVRGISLFLVPKFLVTEEGVLSDQNFVHCASLEHKMGLKGSATCVMNFDQAQGYLVGELYKGLPHMFMMMNNERLAVGNQGLGIGEVSYQNALNYAHDRLQGRSLSGKKYPNLPADPLLSHPDIRRMILTMKALTEGNRMLNSWVTYHLDMSHHAKDPNERQQADDFVQLMTPLVKAYLTDCGVEICHLGIQVYGGHGYIKDYGMEQYLRDARICQIYEGTNGIQALDLIGRKLPAYTGRYLRSFFHPIDQFIELHQENLPLNEFLAPLKKSFNHLQQITVLIAERGLQNPDEAGAAATDYLKLLGLVASAYLWTKAVTISQSHLKGAEADFYESKIATARFFMHKILPQTFSLCASIKNGATSLMDVPESIFKRF